MPPEPTLLEALKDKSEHACSGAAYALGKIGTEVKDVVPALIIALKDNDRVVRMSAARAMGDIGPAAKGALPALEAALKDKDYRAPRPPGR